MTGLCGDFTWLPCGPLVGQNDIDLFADDSAPQERRKKRPLLPEAGNSTPIANGDKNVPVNGSGAATSPPLDTTGEKAQEGDVPMADGAHPDTNGETRLSDAAGKEKSPQKESDTSPNDAAPDKNPETEIPAAEKPTAQESGGSTDKTTDVEKDGEDGTDPDKTEDVGMQDADQPAAADAEATEQQDANGKPQPAPPADPDDEALIHPFFHPPAYPLPDRDLGLPENEAENVRHLMSLYVQKQEEIARGAAKLHEGLMKADRLRATVLQWAKAEAHVGEMSDGEDWYDKEEWRLEGELKKGQDEEEEDTTQPVKKTRNRRQ